MAKCCLSEANHVICVAPETPPDFIAFVITLLMMTLFFFGVKKTVKFNNVLNVVNVAAWLIIVLVGLHYIK